MLNQQKFITMKTFELLEQEAITLSYVEMLNVKGGGNDEEDGTNIDPSDADADDMP